MNDNNLLAVLAQIASFAASFSGIAAGIIMANVTKKFGTGILAFGFKAIAIGIIFIGAGIITDAFATYILAFNKPVLNTILLILKEVFFVLGAYIIVIGSKKTADKLEALTKS